MHGTFYTHALADVSIFALARAHPTVPLAVRAAGVSMKVMTACNVRSRAAQNLVLDSALRMHA